MAAIANTIMPRSEDNTIPLDQVSRFYQFQNIFFNEYYINNYNNGHITTL